MRKKLKELIYIIGTVALITSSLPLAYAALTLTSTAITSDGVLTVTGSGASTWDLGASNPLSLQTVGGAAVITGGSVLIAAGSAIDSSAAGALNIGTTTSTSIVVGKAGNTITLFGVTSSTEFRTTSATISVINGNPNLVLSGEFTNNGFRSTSATLATINGVVTHTAAVNVIGEASTTAFRTASATISSLLHNATGTAIVGHFSVTASLNFATVATSTCKDLPVTLAGVSSPDSVVLGAPGDFASSTTVVWSGWASTTAGSVQVRVCNIAIGNTNSVSTARTWTIDVWKH